MNPKYPPGSDLIAKLVLRDPNVIDIIVTTVVGKELSLTLVYISC
jgi:hypothetical protein